MKTKNSGISLIVLVITIMIRYDKWLKEAKISKASHISILDIMRIGSNWSVMYY